MDRLTGRPPSDVINERCTYATPDELAWLRTAAGDLPAFAQVVMIGAGPGVMGMAVLEGISQAGCTLWIVDIARVEYATAHIHTAGLDQLAGVIYHVGDSSQLGRAWAAGPVHLLIVDGDHSPRGVTADMDAWLPHVAPGGLAFFHDFDHTGTHWAGQALPTVELEVAARMSLLAWWLVARVGCSAVFQRPAA